MNLICPTVLFLLFFTHLTVSAQYTQYPTRETPPLPSVTQAIFAELGGPGMLLSLNYDTRFSHHNNGWGMRAGLGYDFSNNPFFLSVPVGVNYLAGHHGDFFELGAGTTFVNITNADRNHEFSLGGNEYNHPAHFFLANTVLGYRHQPAHGGLNVRAGITPYIGNGNGGVIPYFSLGYDF